MPALGTLVHVSTTGPAVLGRDPEQERLRAFLSGSGPSLLLITGGAGIGKTTLLRFGVDLARAQGLRVLSLRPGQAEADLSYAGLAGLLTDAVLAEVRPGMPGARRAALEVALAQTDEPSTVADPAVVGLGVVSALQTLCADASLLLVIDDLQWVDAATVFVLDFALRRLDGAAVRLLAAARSDDVTAGMALEDAFTEDRRDRLPLGPMSVGTLGRLVQDRLTLVLPRLAAVQLSEESGGNPLVALELARAAAARGTVPGPGERFQPTSDVMALLGARISGLPPDAREALQVLATAARPDLPMLSEVQGEDTAESVVTALVDAQLAVVDGLAVRCAHPLVASAAYAQMLPPRRRRLHARLSELARDMEERARHLALSTDGPDEQVAVALDAAARLAQRRGASVAAAQLCELAVTATAPTDSAALARRELELARRKLEAGDPSGAKDTAIRSLDRLPAGPGRVDTLLMLSGVEQARAELADARTWLAQALAEAGSDRAALARAHVAAGMTAWESVGTERAHAVAAVQALAGHEDEDPTTAATALVLLAGTDFEAGEGLRVDLLDRAVELEHQTDLVAMMRPSTQRAIFLGHAGRLEQSMPAIVACLEAAQREGDQSARPHLLRTLAWMELGAGRLVDARVHIEQAMALADELDLADAYIWAVAGQIHAALGENDVGVELCQNALARARQVGNPWGEVRALGSVGFVHLTADRFADAAAALVAADGLDTAGELVEVGWQRVHGDLVESLAACGRLSEATEAAHAFAARAAKTGHPWSAAVSARGIGQVHLAAGHLDEAVAAFEGSLASPAMVEMRLERARSLLALGGALRRANRRRDAREALQEAAAAFDGLGSGPWAAKARAELGTVSGRAASADDLTAMQRRVAALAAVGRTNAEIAQELYLSVRTVEAHLAAAYRKLGARSRTELAARMAGTLAGPGA